MSNRLTLFSADLMALSLSAWLSHLWFPTREYQLIWVILISIKIILFARSGLYHAILRFAGLPLASSILNATTISSLFTGLLVHFSSSQKLVLGFFVMDYLISSFLIGLIRFAPRYFSEKKQEKGFRRVLIYGAGDLGEDVARKLLRSPEEYELIGFIDDNKKKIGKNLHNLPIFGPIENLEHVIVRTKASELIITISAIDSVRVRDLTRLCCKNHVSCRIVPSFPDMLRKDINIKDIDISDLLKRDPKDLDEKQIQKFIQGRSILITGAGGSIGSELARQCIKYKAAKLIFVDHSEYNLYVLEQEFIREQIPMKFRLINILNNDAIEKIMASETPSIIFHAAAYKHVPLVEENPFEGVINNVQGTINIAQLAEKYGVEKFVLISTDKAVRPTNVMGATKRIAELYIQNLNVTGKAEYISVRFGNVLGSSGSVIPKFIDQINKGGPITVTHPEVTRYFMLTSEAAQLVLQAASIGNGGEIFILNMGQPVKIASMAEDLIFLAGREPHKEIKIEYTGLRPGEKLYEELLHDESEKKTQYVNITVGRATYVDWDELNLKINRLLKSCQGNNRSDLLGKIKELVPEFMHADLGNKIISLIKANG